MNVHLRLTPEAERSQMVLRKARKTHKCQTGKKDGAAVRAWDHGELPTSHTPEIAPTDYYVEYLGKSPAYSSGCRYCAMCACAAGLATWY